MWTLFFLSAAICVAILYLPCSVILRSFNYPWLTSIAAAPILSVVLYSIEAILFQKIDIWCSFSTLFPPVLIVAILCCAISLMTGRWRKDPNAACLRFLVLYVAFALAIGLFFYVKPLDGPSCFSQAWDDFTHYGLIQSFIDTGVYSMLNGSVYANLGEAGSYYPAGWHLICAMTETALPTNNALASNAVNYVICSVVYPSGCMLLTHTLFPGKKQYHYAGILLSVAFVAFPWSFLIKGKIVSNMLGYSLIPTAMSLFVSALKNPRICPGTLKAILLFTISIISAVFTQPNFVFSLMVILFPYCICFILKSGKRLKTWQPMLTAFIIIVVFCLLWVALYNAPFLQGVVSYNSHKAFSSPLTAVFDLLLISYSRTPPQIALGLLVIFGIAACLKRKCCRWILVSYVLLSLMYLVDACIDGPLKNFLTGFWYSDARRVSALIAIVSYPLAVIGLVSFAEVFKKERESIFYATALGITIAIGIYSPNIPTNGLPQGEVTTAFGDLKNGIVGVFNQTSELNQFFSTDEQEFVKEVKEIVGDNLVENDPSDGSSFAYGFYGLNVIHRSLASHCDIPEEQKLDDGLDKISQDQSIEDAARKSNVKYVLQLDQGHESPTAWPDSSDHAHTPGVKAINDETNGFTIVLEKEDMRLYRIDAF